MATLAEHMPEIIGVPYTAEKYTDEDSWHALRSTGIGGSDAGTIAGLNNYKQPVTLYYEKRGEKAPDDLSDNDAVHFGNVLEDTVAEEYARRTGNKVRRNNHILRSKAYPFMLANLDREIVGQNQGLECKTAGAYINTKEWGKGNTYETQADGTILQMTEDDIVPETYQLQCQHYMAVTGKLSWDLAVLIGGRDFRIYTIHRHEELIGNLIDIELEFWNRVQTSNPPAIDHNARNALDTVKGLFPGTNGESITFNAEILAWHTVLKDAGKRVDEYQRIVDGSKAHILEFMGENAKGLFTEGGGYTRKEVNRAGYSVEPASYMAFRFSPNLGKKKS